MWVKWAFESITMNKANEGDGIRAEQFPVLGDDAVKVLYSICHQTWKIQQATGLEKVSVHSSSKEGDC